VLFVIYESLCDNVMLEEIEIQYLKSLLFSNKLIKQKTKQKQKQKKIEKN